jgi:hypothetical protein
LAETVSQEFSVLLKKVGGNVPDLAGHPARSLLHGGRAILETWSGPEYKKSKNARGLEFVFEARYIRCPRWPNAVIKKVGRVHCLGVFDTILLPLTELARFLFSRKNTLTFIGDPEKETEEQWPSSIPLGLASVSHRDPIGYTRLLQMFVPKCSVRSNYCDLFIIDMLEYLWLHEYAHGVDGHADFFEETQGTFELFEYEDLAIIGNTVPKRIAVRQIVELVADDLASKWLLWTDILSRRTQIEFSVEQWAAFRYMAIMMVQFLWCQIDRCRDQSELFSIDRMGAYPTSSFRMYARMYSIIKHNILRLDKSEKWSHGELQGALELQSLAAKHTEFDVVNRLQYDENVNRRFADYGMHLAVTSDLQAELANYRYELVGA